MITPLIVSVVKVNRATEVLNEVIPPLLELNVRTVVDGEDVVADGELIFVAVDLLALLRKESVLRKVELVS